jgi:hypothetical protein
MHFISYHVLSQCFINKISRLTTVGSVAYDCGLKEEVLFMSVALCFLGDSPMAAEVTNTPNPGQSNNPCGACHLRTERQDKKSNIY